MDKRKHIWCVLFLLICYILFTWQHLFTNKAILPKDAIQLYYAIGLTLFLGTCFMNYLYEKFHSATRFATFTYILLFLTGAPFLFKVVLYILLK